MPFRLVAEKTEMAYEESQQLSVEAIPPKGVDLVLSPASPQGSKIEGLTYTAPSKEEAGDTTEVIIKAKDKEKEDDFDSITIRLKQKE